MFGGKSGSEGDSQSDDGSDDEADDDDPDQFKSKQKNIAAALMGRGKKKAVKSRNESRASSMVCCLRTHGS